VHVAPIPDAATFHVRATVHNAGARPGGHVVQAYVNTPSAERFLVGFARVEVPPGAAVPVRIAVPFQRFATRQGPGLWTVPPGRYRFDIGADAADPASISVTIALPAKKDNDDTAS